MVRGTPIAARNKASAPPKLNELRGAVTPPRALLRKVRPVVSRVPKAPLLVPLNKDTLTRVSTARAAGSMGRAAVGAVRKKAKVEKKAKAPALSGALGVVTIGRDTASAVGGTASTAPKAGVYPKGLELSPQESGSACSPRP
jgi:hypothetical protein